MLTNQPAQPNPSCTPSQPGRGTLHDCEPEDEDLLAGSLWELDLYGDDERKPAVDVDLLDPLATAGVDVAAVRQAWMAAGSPSPYDGGAPFIERAVEAAVAGGYDAYDSDTRTWIYANPVACDHCQGPSAKELARALRNLLVAFGSHVAIDERQRHWLDEARLLVPAEAA